MKAKKFSRAKHNPMALALRNHKTAKVRDRTKYTRKVKHKG